MEREQMGVEGTTGELGGTGAGWAESEAGRVQQRAENFKNRVRDEAGETLRGAREKVSRAYDRTADNASRAYRSARGYAQEHPDMAAALCFATGVGVGMMMSGRNGGMYRRGLVPVVAVALAQAVLDVFGEDR
jgi:ElaB/YqjD/DUF883 family membrane-anchored ribosome-binding protein